MEKQNHTPPTKPRLASHRSFRRWVRQLFTCLRSHQEQTTSRDTELILSRIDEVENLIEVIACQLARMSKPDKGARRE